MDALRLLRDQAELANGLMTRVFANVTAAQAVWRADGSTANPIATTFLHVYEVEDRLVQRACRGEPTILESGGWSERLGYDPSVPWSPLAHPDVEALRAFAADVHAATREFLDGLDPEALEREIQTSRGPRRLSDRASLILVVHKATHTGEIAALLGCQGVKGFPV